MTDETAKDLSEFDRGFRSGYEASDSDNARPKIYKAIAACMRDIDAIGKARKNTQQGYSFRGIDDVYNELHDVLGKHEVFTVPFVMEDRTEERTTKSGTALIYRVLKIHFTFYGSDGTSITACVMGEGMDSGDKASNKAMAVAHKYALMQVFCIPTEDLKDPEHDSHEVKPRAAEPLPRGSWTPEPTPAPPARELAFTQSNVAACVRVKKILQEANIIDPATISETLSKLEGVAMGRVRAELNTLTNGKVPVDVPNQ